MDAGTLRRGATVDPPGPRGWRALRCLLSSRLDFLARMPREHGDVSMVRAPGRAVYVLGHPDVVREVFVRQAGRLAKAHGYRRLAVLMGDGLLTSNGDLHASQRRRLLPSLAPERVRSFASEAAAIADEATSRWEPGRSRDVHRDLARVSLRVLERTLLRSGSPHAPLPAARAVELGTRILDLWGELPGFAALVRLPIPPILAFHGLRRRLDAWARGAIAHPRAPGAPARDGVEHLLTAADPADPVRRMGTGLARDELVTLLMAGHETSASALAFALHLLSRSPTWEERAAEEVDRVLGGRLAGPDDLPRLELCRRVLLESLRLFPPIFGLSRLAVDDVVAGGWRIPRGSMVCASIFGLHQDPRLWDDPRRFDPDRWLPGRIRPASKDAFVPFGLADRRCVGEHFFWATAPAVLGAVLARWRLSDRSSRSGRALALRAAVTLRPAQGVWLAPRRRAPAGR